MYKRSVRMDRGTFSRVFTEGRRYHTPFFTLVYTPSPERRVAVVVSKKVAKTAVARNRLRRRAYMALRAIPVERGELIVLLKPQAQQVTFQELKTTLLDAYALLLGGVPKPR